MKKIIKIALVTFFVTIIGYNIYSYKQSVEVVSDLVLANVEALAHLRDNQKDHGICVPPTIPIRLLNEYCFYYGVREGCPCGSENW